MSIVIENPLAEYISPEEHTEHARFARLVWKYHQTKAEALTYRKLGNIPMAQYSEGECGKLATKIEKATS